VVRNDQAESRGRGDGGKKFKNYLREGRTKIRNSNQIRGSNLKAGDTK
jgi:hypothetical protein